MKFIMILAILGLLVIAGCAQQPAAQDPQSITLTAVEPVYYNGYCAMTSTTRISDNVKYEEQDDIFLMLDELFNTQEIACDTDNDCYEFLLGSDEYRAMAPEFEPYFGCEQSNIQEIVLMH